MGRAQAGFQSLVTQGLLSVHALLDVGGSLALGSLGTAAGGYRCSRSITNATGSCI